MRGVDLEPLQPRERDARLRLRLELHERDPGFASTMRTSLNPGNCWKSIDNICAVVASARRVGIETRGQKRQRRAGGSTRKKYSKRRET